MDFKKLIQTNDLSNFPIGAGGCRVSATHEIPCVYDLVVFDEKSESKKIIEFENEYVIIHHASLSEKNSKKLLEYDNLQIIQDDSWDLRMFLSKINQKQDSFFSDFAKSSLIESLLCCQKTIEGVNTSDVFASCWQKCASFNLADALSALNHQRPSSPHMLDLLRKSKKNTINEHLSIITQSVGIERSTPVLLERMLKSTIGFSDLIEKNNHSKIIQRYYDFFLKNAMLSDCYFYLGYVNKENFVKIRDSLNREPDLIHILKIAFDVEADSNLLLRQAELVKNSCNSILEIISNA